MGERVLDPVDDAGHLVERDQDGDDRADQDDERRQGDAEAKATGREAWISAMNGSVFPQSRLVKRDRGQDDPIWPLLRRRRLLAQARAAAGARLIDRSRRPILT